MKWIISFITILIIGNGTYLFLKLSDNLSSSPYSIDSSSLGINLGILPKVDRLVPDEVIIKSIITFSQLIDSSNYSEFGLSDLNQLSTLKIGTQYKKYFIELYKILNYNGFDSIHQLCNRNYSIEIPLKDSISGKALTSIEYKLNKSDKWEASAYGSSSIFRNLTRDSLYASGSVGELFLIEVPAMNTGFYYFRDSITGLLNSRFLGYNSRKDSTSNYTDLQLLQKLKIQAQKTDFRFPG